MHATRVPPGLRVTQVADDHLDRLVELGRDVESAAFGVTQCNRTEMLGALRAPELHGARGTVALWDADRLAAVALAYDALEHASGLYLDLFIHPEAPARQDVATCLLSAARAYAAALGPPEPAWVKSESFDGDTDVEAAFGDLGYEQHRVYLRMRLDFDAAPVAPEPPTGISVRTMVQSDWEAIHDVITTAFLDHYDFHPEPFEVFRENFVDETTDFGQWRLAFAGDRCVGLCLGSKRYAAHRLGYVASLAVLRDYRGRGIARFLLHDAFARDASLGYAGTSLHCDATNPTGATALYESVGMLRDQRYTAWRTRL